MDGDAALAQPFSAAVAVAGLIGMLVAGAVHLDRQTDVFAVEVEDVGANGMLAAEAQTVKAATAKRGPEEDLGKRQSATKVACAFDGLLRRIHGLYCSLA